MPEGVKCWNCGKTIEVESGRWRHFGTRTVFCAGGEPYGDMATPA